MSGDQPCGLVSFIAGQDFWQSALPAQSALSWQQPDLLEHSLLGMLAEAGSEIDAFLSERQARAHPTKATHRMKFFIRNSL